MHYLHTKTTIDRLVGMLLVFVLLAALLAACGSQRTEEPAGSAPTTSTGSELFESLGCSGCHRMDGSGPGPSLAGIYGETIPLENGESVTVDEQYIRTSLLDPQAQIHAGYLPIMPSYEGRIGEEEITRLIDYIRALEE